MPPIIQNDLVLAEIFFKHVLSPREAMITFAFNDGTVNNSAQAWADYIQNSFAFDFKSALDTEVSIQRTKTLKGNGTVDPEMGLSVAAATPGVFAFSGTTPNTAILLQKRTAFGGRRNRGRVYLPWFLNEGNVNEVGLIVPAGLASVQASVTSWFGSANIGSAMVIANRVYDLPWDNPARQLLEINIGKPVTALVLSNMAATQRRRMPR